jgi:hypothetical protein
MRDYTYIGGARFSICNIFRSLRFDIDRLDMNWVDGEKPVFSRGLRIVDNDEGSTVTVDGEEGDSLVFSLAYIFNRESDGDSFRSAVDDYLKDALANRNYLVTKQKRSSEDKKEVIESVLH